MTQSLKSQLNPLKKPKFVPRTQEQKHVTERIEIEDGACLR